MLVIPLKPLPSQLFNVSLNNQLCAIRTYQKTYGLFVDLYVSNELVIAGVLSLNATRIVRNAYLGFDGDLAFVDTQGDTQPYYTGLGTRYQFLYLDEIDLITFKPILTIPPFVPQPQPPPFILDSSDLGGPDVLG